MLKTAVVILNWNGEKYLKQFLPVLIQNTTNHGAEIIVADNASTDGSMELLAKEFSQIRTIVLDKNYGFAGGYNKALAQVDAEYYVLLNSDVEVSENWLDSLIDFLDKNQDVAACQPKIKAFHDKKLFEHAGAAGGFIDKYGFPFCRGRIMGSVEVDSGQYDEVKDIFWASGACLMVRSKVYWEVGGLDDEFFAHMEEIDLCWRINSRGYRIVCVPQSEVFHVGGGTLNTESPYKTYLNFRNNQLMLYKNLPQKDLKRVLCARFWFDYVAALQLFVTGKRKNAYSVFKARRDYKKLKPSFELKRAETQRSATKESLETIYSKSIVFNYYLKSKQKFNLLKF